MRMLVQQRVYQQLLDMSEYELAGLGALQEGRHRKEFDEGLPRMAGATVQRHAQFKLQGLRKRIAQTGATRIFKHLSIYPYDELITFAFPAHMQWQGGGKDRCLERVRFDELRSATDLGSPRHGHLHQQEILEAIRLDHDVGPVAQPVNGDCPQGKVIHMSVECL